MAYFSNNFLYDSVLVNCQLCIAVIDCTFNALNEKWALYWANSFQIDNFAIQRIIIGLRKTGRFNAILYRANFGDVMQLF